MLVLAGIIFDLRCSMRNLYLWHVETVVMPCENSLVVAWELFGWSMWDIVPWSGLEPRSPPLRVWSLSHWTTKEVPIVTDINHNMIHLYGINSALTWVVFYAATVNVHWPFSLLLQFYFYDCIPVDLRAKKKKKGWKVSLWHQQTESFPGETGEKNAVLLCLQGSCYVVET